MSPEPSRKPLLPPEVQAKLPVWGSTAGEADPIASVKLVLSCDIGAVFTWYVVEYDGQDKCYGLVIGDEIELEAIYFSLSDLEGLYPAMEARGLAAEFRRAGQTVYPVKREEQFQPARLSVLRRYHQASRQLAARGYPLLG